MFLVRLRCVARRRGGDRRLWRASRGSSAISPRLISPSHLKAAHADAVAHSLRSALTARSSLADQKWSPPSSRTRSMSSGSPSYHVPADRRDDHPAGPSAREGQRLFDAMNRAVAPGSAFMWRVFGVNFVTLSIIKFLTLFASPPMPAGDSMATSLVYCFCVYGLVAIGILGFYIPKFMEKKADLILFFALFALETIAWWAIALS